MSCTRFAGFHAFMRMLVVGALLIFALSLVACGASSGPAKYDGAWVNDDASTGGVTALIISHSINDITVHGYGKCHPTDCDWNTRTAAYSADPFVILFDFGGGLTHQLTISFTDAAGTKLQAVDVGSASGTNTYTFHRGAYPPTLTPTPILRGTFSEYPIPSPNAQANGITRGPDGALWFTEINQIGRITTTGSITEFTIPIVGAINFPFDITAGPDGALWFTENTTNKIGRITTTGSITLYPVPTAGDVLGIATGPDGALWFTEEGANKIGRITTSGTITEYAVPTPNSEPYLIAAGPDGALWFTEYSANKIGHITTGGSVTEYAVPTPNSTPTGITVGPDGALWFTEEGANKIGRIVTSGSITEFSGACEPRSITRGPDGALWFTEVGSCNRIGRITTNGSISEFSIPTPGSGPFGITAGPDGALWFTEVVIYANKIGRVTA
jgi:virginiamycin B lyase